MSKSLLKFFKVEDFPVSAAYVSRSGDFEDVELRGKIPYLKKTAEVGTSIELLM